MVEQSWETIASDVANPPRTKPYRPVFVALEPLRAEGLSRAVPDSLDSINP